MTTEEQRKYVLSIDVGVKNLAIALLSVAVGGKQASAQIHFWKWYDVTSVAAGCPLDVKGTKKRGKKSSSIEMGKCVNILRKTGRPQCGNPGPLNERGRAYCGIHDPAKKHKPEDTQAWCYAMLLALPAIGDELDRSLDTSLQRNDLQIVIEQQSVDNKKIMMQSHLIYGFFVSRYVNSIPVRFVPAYNKLLVYDGPVIECSLKTKYAVRKFTGRKHTEYFLSQVPALEQWQAFYDGCKGKQDDVADAFLQGLYVLIGKPKDVKEEGIASASNEAGKPRRIRRKARF